MKLTDEEKAKRREAWKQANAAMSFNGDGLEVAKAYLELQELEINGIITNDELINFLINNDDKANPLCIKFPSEEVKKETREYREYLENGGEKVLDELKEKYKDFLNTIQKGC